ncbi:MULTISPECIES: DUF4376 domain-containing protein [unclassified Pseudomonas]|uniref:DUF4376 domain-containing protein n=1 Tax=unclassified Pseudomonas TaxID=196821 RepID=UPI0002A2BEE0|nr:MULTISPECIES: DUF4376 domain-containing protein [unclassified Pseudomonas]MBB1605199.1 phage tail protein [Pseudomonas sp. UMC76]MBB1642036.1 phage tail protein [Pseudomonas sp. UME83]NTX92164.1 DUF4376 domain-containing protein [Pseudomonas sp. UMA643]NTY21346.1 DUF4376 domain-containing protein [Pseudomonas sp. UMC3103]NTY27156.1 DUF4376 domain-containing protein [Pseudomonas sp. UMA603]
MFYSPSTGGFYIADIHGDAIPGDAIEITQEEHAALLDDQASGKTIVAGPDGRPLVLGTSTDYLAVIAARRYQAETAGITVNGTDVPTARDSQALVTAAMLAAVLDPNYTCRWKTTEGFVTLDAQALIAMASAMRAHVQACFDREAELLAHLEAGTFEESMLDQGWPA